MPDKNQTRKDQGQEWGKSTSGNQPGGGKMPQSRPEDKYGNKPGQHQSSGNPQKSKPYDPDERII